MLPDCRPQCQGPCRYKTVYSFITSRLLLVACATWALPRRCKVASLTVQMQSAQLALVWRWNLHLQRWRRACCKTMTM